MDDPPQYAWFIANVWPDANGVPTASIFEWDRAAGTAGRHVTVVTYGPTRPFRRVMEELHYEVVVGQLTEPVTPTGVLIALRRETVPVYVPAPEYVPA